MKQANVIAIERIFPDADIKIYYLYVKRNISKKWKFPILLKNNIGTKKVVMLCGALPLLPTD